LARTPRLPLARASLAQVAVFWHFVGGLWLYLLAVLTIL
jgi:heme/copper-type cytochrome/quinol oxidase subunit 3